MYERAQAGQEVCATLPHAYGYVIRCCDDFAKLKIRQYEKKDIFCQFNPLPTNDASMRHGLSISLWEFIWGI